MGQPRLSSGSCHPDAVPFGGGKLRDPSGGLMPALSGVSHFGYGGRDVSRDTINAAQ